MWTTGHLKHLGEKVKKGFSPYIIVSERKSERERRRERERERRRGTRKRIRQIR